MLQFVKEILKLLIGEMEEGAKVAEHQMRNNVDPGIRSHEAGRKRTYNEVAKRLQGIIDDLDEDQENAKRS